MAVASIFPAVLLLAACISVTCTQPPSDCKEESENNLVCHLSSINSRLERTDFSVIPNTTVGLTVVCSQQVAGQLQDSAFSALPRLQQLTIRGCVLRELPARVFNGLRNLRDLSLQTHTTTVQPGTFSGLGNLRSLDLSQNSLGGLPAGELCGLGSLRRLNLSHNALTSLASLGAACPGGSGLVTLDLSHNQLTAVEAWPWRGVQELSLAHNYIRFIGDGVFANSSLQVLELSNNQISHLPASLLRGATLRELGLANNSVSAVAWDLLQHQFSLETLDLSGNLLASAGLPHNLSLHLPNLLHLDLASNQLTGLHPDLTRPLVNLQTLRLGHNQLAELSLSQRMINLANLDLSHNLLQRIEETQFSGLESLTHLSVAANQIAEIDGGALRNLSSLLVLDISDNQLFSLPDGVRFLTNLQTLDVSNNFISDLSPASLAALSSLWRLQMRGNLLLNISADLFSALAELQILDLSRNRIARVDSGAFARNAGLRAVRLDGNQLRALDGVFTEARVPGLIWLNVSENKIQHFDYSLFPRSLGWLDISHNEVSALENLQQVQASSLSYLDLSFNQLRHIEAKSFLENLETLLLNDNKISSIAPYTFYAQTRLAKVDLSVNELASFPENAIRLSRDTAGAEGEKPQPVFNLGGNPITCDCNMQWFKSVNERTKAASYPHIIDIESIYCQLVDTEARTFVPLVEARNDQFLCPYQTHCFSLCQCCQFDSCDCEMICPEGCSCFHDNSWSKNIIQCSSNSYRSLPTNMPMDATEIYLDGNDLGVLKSHSLIGRKNLRVLYLNNSNIEKIQNKTFNGLRSLRALHLEDNKLRSLHGFEFRGLHHLRELYLQGNLLTSINNATFKALRSLEVLSLEGNSIIDFPIWQLAINPYLVSIRLANNLWSCDCEFLNRFSGWMKVFSSRVADADQVTCVSNDLEKHPASGLRLLDHEAAVCEVEAAVAGEWSGLQAEAEDRLLLGSYLPLLIAVVASVAALLVAALVTFTFRHSIKLWLRAGSHNKRDLASPGGGSTSTVSGSSVDTSSSVYEEPRTLHRACTAAGPAVSAPDTFVTYSPLDAAFVHQILGPELQQGAGRPGAVCLQHRDLPASDSAAASHARRTVCVLSNNYLRTEWQSSPALRGHLSSLAASKGLVWVLLGAQDLALQDPGLCSLLTSPAVTVLQWAEPQFWAKLRAVLPGPSLESHYYSTCKFPPSFRGEKEVLAHDVISHI